jgi:hypothetical protein
MSSMMCSWFYALSIADKAASVRASKFAMDQPQIACWARSEPANAIWAVGFRDGARSEFIGIS